MEYGDDGHDTSEEASSYVGDRGRHVELAAPRQQEEEYAVQGLAMWPMRLCSEWFCCLPCRRQRTTPVRHMLG